jgi:hypothetical protein
MYVPQARGGVVPVSRASELTLESVVEEQTFDDARNGDEFGVFNDSLAFEGGDPNGTHARGSASQNTNVASANGRLTGSGNLLSEAFAQFNPEDTSGPLVIFGGSTLTVLFDIIDSAELFETEGSFLGGGPRGATGQFSLQEISDPDAMITILSEDNAQGQTFERSVTLQPGSYRLHANVGTGSSGSSPGDPYSFGQDASLNFTFAVGTEAVVIPLPAAAWPGLVMLLIAGAKLRRR